MSKIKIICVMQSGGPTYNADYIHNMHNNIIGKIDIDFEFICYSDVDSPWTKPLTMGLKKWWPKVEAFKETGPCIYFDLDTCILGNITEMALGVIASPDTFWMKIPVSKSRRRRLGYTSSVMAWNGDFSFMATEFVQPEYKIDQRYFAEAAKERGILIKYVDKLLPERSFSSYKRHIKKKRRRLNDGTKICYFHGKPRPHAVGFPFWTIKGDYSEMKLENLKDMYLGETLFLCCSGPSFAEVDHDMLDMPGIITMGVNNCPSVFRPHLWTHVDPPHKFLPSIWADPSILKFSSGVAQNTKLSYHDDLFPEAIENPGEIEYGGAIVSYKLNSKFDPKEFLTEETVNFGNSKENGGSRSVLLAALKIAYVLGFRRIFLLGADFKMEEGKQNYCFDQDRTKGAVRGNNTTYAALNERLDVLRPVFEEGGLSVYNCNPDSGLKSFETVSFDDAIKMALEKFPDPIEESPSGRYDPKRGKKRIRDQKSMHERMKESIKKERQERKKSETNSVGEIAKRWDSKTPIEVGKGVAISGMSRSGTHAAADWIANQHSGRVDFRNNLFHRRKEVHELCDPRAFGSGKRWYLLPSMPEDVDLDQPISTLVYIYENQPSHLFRAHDLVRCKESVCVILLRDPYNLLATLAKHIENGRGWWFKRMCGDGNGGVDEEKLDAFSDLWMSHANMVGTEGIVPFLYNKWVESVEYRDELAAAIGVDNRSDSSLKNVPTNGRGSSFDKRRMDGNGDSMKVTERWRYYEDAGWFRRFFQNRPEIVEMSERLFGRVEGTEALLKK